MSTQKERQRARKIEKQRKKRDIAQRTRGSRKPPSAAGAADIGDAAGWPLSDCWIGESWHERGAAVHALFSRRHDDGRVAVALFEVDLAERGVVDAQVVAGVSEAAMQGELARRAEEHAMVAAQPGLVVTLVEAARRHGERGGHAQPAGLERATQLFGAVRADDAQHEIRCGTEEGPPEAPPQRPGILTALKRRLGLGS